MPELNTDNSINFFLPLSKVKENKDGSVTVSGYASTPSLDMDGEIVSLDAVKNALPGYWQWRNIREMHRPIAVGVAKEANVDSTGLFLTSRITDKEAAKKCLDGVYKGYSLGGKKLAKSGNTITELELIEISIVDRPANPDCKIDVAKAASPDAPAFLVEAKPDKLRKTPEQKALAKMAGIVELLAKNNPPAARDGLSLPAPVAKADIKCAAHDKANCPDCLCKEHGTVDCAECAKAAVASANFDPIIKRDFTPDKRKELASSGAALPDGSYPIENKGDLDNAVQAFGRAKDKGKAKKHIMRRAKALGHADTIPEGWKKSKDKTAKSSPPVGAPATGPIALAASTFDLGKSPSRSAEVPSFLTLSADGRGYLGSPEPGNGEGVGSRSARKGGTLDADRFSEEIHGSTTFNCFGRGL